MASKEVTEICQRYLSRREERSAVEEAVERCLKKKYDYEKLRSKVLDAVSDSHKAHKIIDKISSLYPQFRKRNKFEESKDSSRDADRSRDRGRDDERDKDRVLKEREQRGRDDRKRRWENDDRASFREKMGRQAQEDKKREEPPKKQIIVTEDQIRAKELMYKAQQEIEERKRQLAAKSTGSIPVLENQLPRNYNNPMAVLQPQEAAVFVKLSMEQKQRMEELKAKLNKSTALTKLADPNKANKEEGGGLLDQKPSRKEREAELNEIKEYVDPRIHNRAAGRKSRVFQFHEKGEFEKLANKQRAVARLDQLQADISDKAKTTGISSAVKLAMVTPAVRTTDTVPEIEWWDQIVLERENYDNIPDVTNSSRFAETISELIEHPIQLRAANDPLTPQLLRVYLTKKEMKKIRRQNRKEMQKEKTEKIRLGFEKAPEPKVKLSNLMRVLGNDAVQDPTKMEAHVRKQMAERLKKHEAENAARKLTDAQKAAKKARKISEDTSIAVHVTVFRVKSLANPSKKFKVETNAKQLQMTGLIVLHKDLNVICVEGGPKQQKFYKNLLLNRIKWSDEIVGEEKKVATQDAVGERNECKLVWEGIVKKRAFYDMKTITCSIQKQARETFEKHRVPHYWDLCLSSQVLLENTDETTE